jgi:hypothetical protein
VVVLAVSNTTGGVWCLGAGEGRGFIVGSKVAPLLRKGAGARKQFVNCSLLGLIRTVHVISPLSDVLRYGISTCPAHPRTSGLQATSETPATLWSTSSVIPLTIWSRRESWSRSFGHHISRWDPLFVLVKAPLFLFGGNE